MLHTSRIVLVQSRRLATSHMSTSSLSAGMLYHQASKIDDSQPKSVAVITGWMGAKQGQMKPYIQYYTKNGIDVISLAVGPKHILFPDDATRQMESVIQETMKLSPDNIIFHQFSMGGYLYGQMLRLMASSPSYQKFTDTIKAQVFDSPPDMHAIPYGISRGLQTHRVIESMVEKLINVYLDSVKDTAGVQHAASSARFHDNHCKAPSLWFYSKTDVIAPMKDCEIVVDKWKAKGIDVTKCVWEDTKHIQHARQDPERYFGALGNFLQRHKILTAAAADVATADVSVQQAGAGVVGQV